MTCSYASHLVTGKYYLIVKKREKTMVTKSKPAVHFQLWLILNLYQICPHCFSPLKSPHGFVWRAKWKHLFLVTENYKISPKLHLLTSNANY